MMAKVFFSTLDILNTTLCYQLFFSLRVSFSRSCVCLLTGNKKKSNALISLLCGVYNVCVIFQAIFSLDIGIYIGILLTWFLPDNCFITRFFLLFLRAVFCAAFTSSLLCQDMYTYIFIYALFYGFCLLLGYRVYMLYIRVFGDYNMENLESFYL